MIGRSPVSRCPVCGARHATCGPRGTGTPVDVVNAPRREPDMSELAEYDVVLNGTRTVMRLTETDAERLGATKRDKATVDAARLVTHEENATVHNRSRQTPDKARKSSAGG